MSLCDKVVRFSGAIRGDASSFMDPLPRSQETKMEGGTSAHHDLETDKGNDNNKDRTITADATTHRLIVGDALCVLKTLNDASVQLIVTSPPYDVGKAYEASRARRGSLAEYAASMRPIIAEAERVLAPGGAICWQVGNRVSDDGIGIDPLDCVFHPLFRDAGFTLKNRIVWRQSHGQHMTDRLSGRHETLLWYVRTDSPVPPTFNLDDVRAPAEFPGKRAYRGARRGALTGNPLGKNPGDFWTLARTEWDACEWAFSSVKAGHPERRGCAHPCPFPIELAERCVLAFSRPGDTVLDPFAGSGTTAVAARFHGRSSISIDQCAAYLEAAAARIEAGDAVPRKLPSRVPSPLDNQPSPSSSPSTGDKRRRYPDEWLPTLKGHLKKPRMAPRSEADYGVAVGDAAPADEPRHSTQAPDNVATGAVF
ncbi:Methyltransferase [Pandoravirus dulcis]|uniref:site-specific DNA-methyltransferase (cytosine-N(4)-specific) n=1 Tax=Pandoravirus dulcis TaxID=1349409 RepID=S4VR68_9VIRU|nr:DNA methyltransferase [Pandoravirus dulcis]AGO82777.2 Methyltransferase [Pandoravirus dulcis]